MNKNIRIRFGGEELEIFGQYEPPVNNYPHAPPESASFELESILYGGINLTSFLTELEIFGLDLEKIEFECLSEILGE